MGGKKVFQPLISMARVKKIIHADDEIANCSNNAAFAIAVATEMFVQWMVEKTHDVIKVEQRPRRQIAYKDVAETVSRLEQLEFLSDVVPKTTTVKEHKARMAKKAHLEANQSTLKVGPSDSAAESSSSKQSILSPAANGNSHATPSESHLEEPGIVYAESMDIYDALALAQRDSAEEQLEREARLGSAST